jgi:myo-inositol-1(or 4)-monophosphatase
VVDPIDGTKDYLRGRSGWAVSVALVEERVPVIGVLAAPAAASIGRLERRGGAGTASLRVSGRPRLARRRVPADQLPADADLVAVHKPNSMRFGAPWSAAGRPIGRDARWGFEWDIAAAR